MHRMPKGLKFCMKAAICQWGRVELEEAAHAGETTLKWTRREKSVELEWGDLEESSRNDDI